MNAIKIVQIRNECVQAEGVVRGNGRVPLKPAYSPIESCASRLDRAEWMVLTQKIRGLLRLVRLRRLAIQLSLQLSDALTRATKCPKLPQLVDDLCHFAIAHEKHPLPRLPRRDFMGED